MSHLFILIARHQLASAMHTDDVFTLVDITDTRVLVKSSIGWVSSQVYAFNNKLGAW
jgi:hypothetical protein